MTESSNILESSELQGLTGDNGETYCVFLRDLANPLNSAWAWFHTEQEAITFDEEASPCK